MGLPGLELSKIRNEKRKYQPFKSAAQLTAAFDGKDGRYLIDKSEIDASVASISAVGPDDEVVINLDSKAIIYDYFNSKLVTCISLEAGVPDGY